MNVDLAALFNTVVHAVVANDSPTQAWVAVGGAVTAAGFPPPQVLVRADIVAEVDRISVQVADVVAREEPPSDVAFFYFGLFDGADYHGAGQAGLYIAGDSLAFSSKNGVQSLSYLPEARFLESGLLQCVKLSALALGPHRNVFDYALMIGAGGLLAKFAARCLGIQHPIVVGFDSGDCAQVD